LHGALGYLIQVSTHTTHLKSDFALMDFFMASCTECEQVGQRVFPTLLAKNDMVRFQTNLLFATLLALVAIAHEAGDAQVLIESRWVLVLPPCESGIIQARDIDLDIFNDDTADRKQDVFDYANDLFYIRFDRWRQSPAALARRPIVESRWPIPLPMATLSPAGATIVHFVFDILAMMDFTRQEDLPLADTRDARDMAPFINADYHLLHMLFTVPEEPDGKRTAINNPGFSLP